MKRLDRGAMRPLIVSLDLEYNQPSQRIIQIGAVIGNLMTGEVVDRFSGFINPGEALNPEIEKLCGISLHDVDSAPDILEGYQLLVAWLKPYADQRSLNPLTWGAGDSQDLREAVRIDGKDRLAWPFGLRWIDVKTVFTSWRAAHNRQWVGGLGRSMTELGLTFQGRRHNALDDAENTFVTYVALLAQFKPELVPVAEMPKALGRHRAS